MTQFPIKFLLLLTLIATISANPFEKEARKIADAGGKFISALSKGLGALEDDKPGKNDVHRGGATLLQKTLRVGLIADQDELSKDLNKSGVWKSYYKQGNLTVNGVYPQEVFVSIDWEEDAEVITSGYNIAGRGMELSTLNYFDGNLYSCGDKTGILFRLQRKQETLVPTPWVILADDVGREGFKCEWATIKGEHLYIGSHGVGKDTSSKTSTKKYVKKISKDGGVAVLDWRDNYDKIAAALNVSYPGYVTHEAAAWSDTLEKWVFAPRRVNKEAYTEAMDEVSGENIFLLASEDFDDIEVRTAGEINSTHGFSSFKFMPYEKDQIVVALKTVENDEPRGFETYFMAFDIEGNVIFPETKIDDHKYEGLEFL